MRGWGCGWWVRVRESDEGTGAGGCMENVAKLNIYYGFTINNNESEEK